MDIQPIQIDEPADDAELSPLERRMLHAMQTADSARTGVKVLRWLAVTVGVLAVVGYAMTAFQLGGRGVDADGVLSFGDPYIQQQWGVFLAGVSLPLAFVGLVLAASFVLDLYAARLDMDVVLADDGSE